MQIGLKLGSLAGVNRIRVSRQSCRRLTGFFPGFALLQLHFEWVECLHPGVHALRPYRGAVDCAANLLALMAGSTLTDSLPDKVQDAYSIRCTPQVIGGIRDGLAYASGQIAVELNAATDNPLILLEADGLNKAYSAGLFHGEPLGLAADHLKLVLCELAALSERRIFRLTTGSLSSFLPPLLARQDRPSIGLMAPQTTAAALVSENRSLAYPSSADSLPTCEDQEDLVAMSTTAARRAAEVLENTRLVVAIEWLCASHALWWRQREDSTVCLGEGTSAALSLAEEVLGGSRLFVGSILRQPKILPVLLLLRGGGERGGV